MQTEMCRSKTHDMAQDSLLLDTNSQAWPKQKTAMGTAYNTTRSCAELQLRFPCTASRLPKHIGTRYDMSCGENWQKS